ncbi:MAG: hypothetical protein KDK97_17995 [Verrucomicrobiales bacterium]|nr:hypothetical protein [Verrucomicrobiales bacterium]
MKRFTRVVLLCFLSAFASIDAVGADLKTEVKSAISKACEYFHGEVSVHGGYVYYYSLDLQSRLGEGRATADQIWLQPPGTPTVGLAFLKAYEATKDPAMLAAATDAAVAAIYGQLQSGGWTNSVDFSADRANAALYRNGKGRKKGPNNSTLDDGISQSVLEFLMRVDQQHGFKHAQIHDSVMVGLEAMLKAQFPNGGFPQVWTGPVAAQPVKSATYPDYDWRTENHLKNYWDMYTLNDDLVIYVSQTLFTALEIYQDERCRQALAKLGDFLLLAQMPAPQPAWAQQYDYGMRPIWARKFEPPAICGRESQGALETLLRVYQLTGDKKYLAPFPSALAYLQKSLLPDGQLARYYELENNKPLYMTDDYKLTNSDADVPKHYGWKTDARLKEIDAAYRDVSARGKWSPQSADEMLDDAGALRVIKALDAEGRWISQFDGERLVGQPKFQPGESYIASAVFAQHIRELCAWLQK